jgi:hypothetical protein
VVLKLRWDAFFGRKKEARDRELEEIQGLIRRIEKRAPQQYRKDRADRYYNYRSIRSYVRPLRLLLLAVADSGEPGRRFGGEAVRTLFLRLRDFYDVRGRLSTREALSDVRLRRKLVHLFTIFYGRCDITAAELSQYLEPLEDED